MFAYFRYWTSEYRTRMQAQIFGRAAATAEPLLLPSSSPLPPPRVLLPVSTVLLTSSSPNLPPGLRTPHPPQSPSPSMPHPFPHHPTPTPAHHHHHHQRLRMVIGHSSTAPSHAR